MATKSLIIEDLGERALLLPQALERALAANDRIKLCFTLLQAAERHAQRPEEGAPELSRELQAAKIDSQFQASIAGSQREPNGSLHVPHAAQILQLIRDDLGTMRAPLQPAPQSSTARCD